MLVLVLAVVVGAGVWAGAGGPVGQTLSDALAAIVGLGAQVVPVLLFAVGVAIGFAKKADGSTALAAVVGYVVATLFFAAMRPYPHDGETTPPSTQPSGIRVGQMRVPIGVFGMIFESRPNVTIEAASLSIKSGNACILRGGS